MHTVARRWCGVQPETPPLPVLYLPVVAGNPRGGTGSCGGLRGGSALRTPPSSTRTGASSLSDAAERSGVDLRGLAIAGLSLAAALGATAWILSRSGADLSDALRYLPAQAHLLALVAFAVEIVARGARVLLVARALDLPLTLGRSVRAQFAGDAAGAMTPSRVGADPAKIAVLRGGGAGVGPSGALLVAEMGAEAFVLLILAGVVALGPWGSGWVALGLGGYAVVVSSVGVAAFFVSRMPDKDPPRLWMRLNLGVGRWESLRGTTRDFRRQVARLKEVPARFIAGILGMTLLHMAARLVILPALVLPLAAVSTESVALTDLVLRPFFVLYATALLPPPGGGGGVELTFATLLEGVLDGPTLAATLIWWRVYTFYLSAALGGIFLFLPRILAPLRSGGEADTEASQERSRGVSVTEGAS